MGRFDGQVAMVTGAGSGIGRAAALQLASEGAAVLVTDLLGESAAEVAGEIERAGGDAWSEALDVTDDAAVRRVVDGAVESRGALDVLISNAGMDLAGRFLDSTPEQWDRVIAVNYRGHVAVAHAVLGQMVQRERGRVVLVASDAGRVGSSGEAVYSGAKGGVIALTKALAREVARHGVCVNCVAPGPTGTPFLDGVAAGNPGLVEALVRSIPLRRLARPEEVARAIAFLASEEAAYITGQTLSVNGGLTMV